MLSDQASEVVMDKVLQEAHTDLANAALIVSPHQIIAVAHNSIRETGDLPAMRKWSYSVESGRQLQEM
jgi:hypothetical protein